MSKQLKVLRNELSPAVITTRMAGEQRRFQILQTAMHLFSERGFRGTTTKEIAQAAGISEAMVFRHFANKEELYSAILDQKACNGGMQDPCEAFADAIQRKDDRGLFEQLATAILAHHDNDKELLLLLTHAALEGHQLADMFWDRNVRQMYDFLTTYIRGRQREGALRQVDPTVVVRGFIGMIIHHSLNNHLWDKARRLLDITNERAAREFTDLLMRGIAVSQPKTATTPRHGAINTMQHSTRPKRQRK